MKITITYSYRPSLDNPFVAQATLPDGSVDTAVSAVSFATARFSLLQRAKKWKRTPKEVPLTEEVEV